MPHRAPGTPYRLTPQLVADHLGVGAVMCLAAQGLGRSFRLHASRPDASHLRRPRRAGGALRWRTRAEERSESPPGSAIIGAGGMVEPVSPLILVRIDGGIEQRAGYYDQPDGCLGWSDGHDAIAERLEAAFLEGDVLLVVDSPGGAAAGIQQATARTVAAKAKYERRVTVWADEMIGSAAMWWAAAVGDEIFIPPAGQIGSIGARGEHMDISGMMAKEGFKKTYFADPPEKVALAPEFPLGPVGEMRGNRDVKISADAFRAAVCAGPLGQRHGLTPEFLVELGADMLTGQAAVDAGLADEVESFDAVVAYALTLAQSAEAKDVAETAARAAQLRASGGSPARARRRASA